MLKVVEELAKKHFAQNEFEKCLALSLENIDIANNNTVLLELGAKSAYELKQFKKCIDLYQSLLEYIPLTDQIALTLGRCNQFTYDREEAKKWYKECLAINNKNCTAMNNLGILFLAEKKYSESMAMFEQALQIDKNFFQAYIGLAETDLAQGRFEDCRSNANKAKSIKQEQPRINLLIGKAYFEERKYDESILALKRELTVSTSCLESELLLGKNFLQKGQYAKSTEIFAKTSARYPKSITAYTHLGVSLVKSNRHKKAIDIFEKVLELDPENIDARTNIASCQFNLGNIDNAVENFHKSLDIKPSTLTYINLSKAYGALGNRDKQKTFAELATKFAPEDTDALINFAKFHEDNGDIQKATVYGKKAVYETGGNPSAYLYLGRLFAKEKRYGEAHNILQQGVTKFADDHFLSGELVRINFLKGQYDDKEKISLWGKYDDYFFEDCGGSSLIISFGSNGRRMDDEENIPLFNFRNILTPLKDYDKLFLRDMDRKYYLTGLKTSAPSIKDLADLILSIKKSKPYKHVVTIGASSGGYGAILYGNLIEADYIVAFNPQTVISSEKETIIKDNIFTVPICKMLRNQFLDNNLYQKCLNLKNFIPFKGNATIHFSSHSSNGIDKRYAEFLKHDKCLLVEYDSSTHLLAHELKEKNQLLSAILDSIKP